MKKVFKNNQQNCSFLLDAHSHTLSTKQRNKKSGVNQGFFSSVRLVDEETDREVLRFDLGEDFSVETAVVICEVYRHNGEWKFNTVGSGFAGRLTALCRNFGLEV